VFNVASGKEESALTGDPVQIVRAVGSPDGSGIYFIGAGGAVSGWRPATGRSATFVIPPRANTKPLNLSVSPDGKLLAVLQEYGTITLYDAVTGARLRESKLLPEIVQNVEFSPDGNLIAVSRVQTIYTFNVADLSQRNKLTAPIQSADRGFQFSPDSRMIAVNGKDYVLIWNTDSGFEIARLPNHPDGASGIAWSPNGKLLATVAFGDKGGAYLWDVSTFLTFGGGSIRQGKIAKAEDEIFTAAWSPKGNQLLLGNIYGTVFVWGIAGN
jgi:WD40 repeat protein